MDPSYIETGTPYPVWPQEMPQGLRPSLALTTLSLEGNRVKMEGPFSNA